MTTLRLSALGTINALGEELSAVKTGMLRGDQSGLERCDLAGSRPTVVGAIRAELPAVPHQFRRMDSRNSRILLAAYLQIADEVDRCKQDYGPSRIGTVIGSSTSGITNAEEALRVRYATDAPPEWYRYAQQEIGAVAEFISEYGGLGGPSYTISTACSSSAKVFASARNLIEAGWCDAVIVGGADMLCNLTLRGFSALGLLSEGPCNPMSTNRSGITIGEAAALFLLERREGGIQLLGVGESSDAHHISTPDPTAGGAITAMRQALRSGGLVPADISYINLHGTGTAHNDAMEAKAVAEVFGTDIPCSSTKPLVGHTLGASGATEAGFLWLALSQPEDKTFLPPHRWDGERDSNLPAIQLVAEGQCVAPEARHCFMSTSFGFGGSNCAVVLGRA